MAERGDVEPLTSLKPANLATLDVVQAALAEQRRDWATCHRGTLGFHRRDPAAWGNRASGVGLTAQIDPHFMPAQQCPASR